MTRINSAIPVECLTDEHLLAEHREIKRLPSFHLKHSKTNNREPKEFCLGSGHVLFFVNKGKFTYDRYVKIHNECLKRGFNVADYSVNWLSTKNNTNWQEYSPTEIEKNLLIDRITERLMFGKKEYYRYYGKKIEKMEAVKILKNC